MKYPALILFLLLALTQHLQAQVKFPAIQAEDWKQDLDVPFLVVVSATHCHFCEILKEKYLAPSLQNPDLKRKVVVREFVEDIETEIHWFNESKLSQKEFLAFADARGTPTMVFFDKQGNILSKSIFGILPDDFFFYKIEASIDDAYKKVQKSLKK